MLEQEAMDSVNDKILLTGFEPFDTFKVNSSWQAVKLLVAKGGSHLVCECLQVDYHSARKQLLKLLELHRPDSCLCTGLATGGRFRLERRARKPEQFSDLNESNLFNGQWPWNEAMESFQETNLPVFSSEDAGQYVCESTCWSLLDFRYQHGYPEKAAFLHVPPLSEGWPVERIASGIKAMLKGV
tara:strand:+ start:1358 stop:1912 length:555 start_codon:yes stop_codon:yes gene_type:complete